MLELTVRLVVSLAIVVGLLLLLARVGQRKFRGGGDAMVQVIHRQPLSRTSAVAVVTVGSRVLVLGTTEQQVSVLAELDPDEVDGNADAESDPDFATALGQALDATQEVAAPAHQPAAIEAAPTAPTAPAKPALPPRPQARPASKPPTWDPMLTIRAQAAVRPAHAPGRAAPAAPTPDVAEVPEAPAAASAPETAGSSSAAVDAILAAVEAHQNGTAVPPALAVLASETGDATVTPAKKATKKARRVTAAAPSTKTPGPLAGSVLSPDTWKQAIAAATSRRAS